MEASDIVVAVVVAVEAFDIVVDTAVAVAVAGKREAAFLVPEAAEEVMDELEFSMEEVVEHFLFLAEVEPVHFPHLLLVVVEVRYLEKVVVEGRYRVLVEVAELH